MYKLNKNSVIRLADNACIPLADGNTDYAQYLAWLAEGNTPIPADIPDPNLAIKAQIKALEQESLLNKGSREMQIWQLEDEARKYSETYGLSIEVILSGNVYYPLVKALDAQCKALEDQLV